jgi:uncharacterized protein
MMPDFRDAIRDYIAAQALPVEKYGHQPRVYALTREIGAGHDYDDDVVFAAAWLHDLGVFSGHRPEDPEELAAWDNVPYAMDLASSLLGEFGFPAEKVSAVVEAIRTHQPAGQATTIEAIILRDADILEQLGAVGILRTACKVGRDSRFPTFTPVVESLRKALATLPGLIRLETTRALAAPRIRVLESFLEGVAVESRSGLF